MYVVVHMVAVMQVCNTMTSYIANHVLPNRTTNIMFMQAGTK